MSATKRQQVKEGGSPGGSTRPSAGIPRAGGPRSPALGLTRIEWLALIAVTGLAFVVLAALLTKGRPLSGADGLLAADQLQYFAWIRDASHHLLIGNRFDLAPGDRAFLHPGFALSGGLHALGVSVPLSYLLWKPVAIGLTFYAALRYVRRLIPTPGARHTALILVAVRRHARVVARRVVGLGRQPAPVHVRLHLRRDVVRAVPLGLPDDRDRGRS